MTLLGKWWLRLKEERGGLWFRVLTTRFGEVDHFLRLEGGDRVWWSNLVSIGRG